MAPGAGTEDRRSTCIMPGLKTTKYGFYIDEFSIDFSICTKQIYKLYHIGYIFE
jgi:hypothetical protein